MKERKRFLVTGAAGSVGSSLVKRLIADGHVVCALDSHEDGMFNLKQEYAQSSCSDSIRYFLGDIRDPLRLKRALEGVDVVFHCAALKHVEMSEINPLETIETNINGVKNIINC